MRCGRLVVVVVVVVACAVRVAGAPRPPLRLVACVELLAALYR